MKVSAHMQEPEGFKPVSVTFTLDDPVEYKVMMALLGNNYTISDMVYERDYLTYSESKKLGDMMGAMYRKIISAQKDDK